MVLQLRNASRWIGGISLLCLGAISAPAFGQEEVGTAPAYNPPPLQNSLLDFVTGQPVSYHLQGMFKNPLVKPPFAGQPLNTPKGLASAIKADQLDAKNRIKAVKFLGTVDCVDHPDSQVLLIKTLKEDKVEKVRLEAAKAIQEQLTHGQSTNASRREKRQSDYCRGCCSADVLNALAERAYGKDEYGCFLEPSERVRKECVEALQTCPCHACPVCYNTPATFTTPPEPQMLEESSGTPPAPAVEETTEEPAATPDAPPSEEAEPSALQLIEPEIEAAPAKAAQRNEFELLPIEAPAEPIRKVSNEAPVVEKSIRRPNQHTVKQGLCIVGLANGQEVAGRAEYQSQFQGHVYVFSSREAKQKFDACPLMFAPVDRGFDPVAKQVTGEQVPGTLLLRHKNRSYMFATQANLDRFLESPELYR